MNNNTVKILALIVAVMLVVSVTTNAYAESKEKKKDIKKTKKIVNNLPKKIEQKPLQTNVTTSISTIPLANPIQEKLAACKTKETQREQYECEKALKASSGDDGFKSKATKTVIGPITFYYAGAKVEKTGGNDIVNLRFLVENTGSKDNVSLYCTGPAVCNYDVSDGTTTYKYAAQDFTNGQIVLKPGASRTFNILFGPAIGYGSYVDFKFDPSKQYTFNVKEPWGSGKIPLNLK